MRRLRERYADREVAVHDRGQHDAETIRRHLRVDGDFLVGTSSGGVVAAIRQLVEAGEVGAEDVVVAPLPDRGDRYRELPLWADQF